MHGSQLTIVYATDTNSYDLQLRGAASALPLAAEVVVVDTEAACTGALAGCALVIADFDCGGLSVARALGIRGPGAVPPLIVVSEGARDEAAVDCMRRGAADYLRRPDGAALAAAMTRALGGAMRLGAEPSTEASRSLERLEALSELTADYAYSLRVDPGVGIVGDWVVGAFTRMTGYRPEDLHSSEIGLSIIHPEDREATVGRLGSLVTGTASTLDYRIVCRGGEVRWGRDTAAPEWSDGSIVRVNGSVRDITVSGAERRAGAWTKDWAMLGIAVRPGEPRSNSRAPTFANPTRSAWSAAIIRRPLSGAERRAPPRSGAPRREDENREHGGPRPR